MPFKKKHDHIDLNQVDGNIISYLQTLPPELQEEIVVTAGKEGGHSKNSRHNHGKAVDLRFSDKVYNYIKTDPNRHKAGLTLIDPNHGTAKHIHLSAGEGTENNLDVDKTGREAWLKNVTPKKEDEGNIPKSSTWLQNYTAPQIQTVSQPYVNGIFDTTSWNPNAWRGEEQEINPSQQAIAETLLKNVNPALRGVLSQMFNETPTKKGRKKKVEEDTEEEETTYKRRQRKYNPAPMIYTPTPTPSSNIGGWANNFKKVEDPNSQFNHNNGAWGTFGYRQKGHLADAFNAPQFQQINQRYGGDYNKYWGDFTKQGYGELSNETDKAYEAWLRDKTGNDINKAARFNYDGYRGLNSTNDYTPQGQMSMSEYQRRMGLENGGWLSKISKK